jgi:L-ribulose-5-phosphate 4-epimerase
MLEELKQQVCEANLHLVAEGLVIQTWGNASGIDRERGIVVIKPSGVPYDGMKPEHMVVFRWSPAKSWKAVSSRVPTRRRIWNCTARFPKIGGVVHTHSLYATAWAQAGKNSLLWHDAGGLLVW